MLFEVIVDVWEYRPKRCTVVVYRRGNKGCLPEKVVLEAEAQGYVRVIGNV